MQQDRPAKEKRSRWLLSKTGDVIFTASVGSIWLWLVGLALPIGYGGAVAVGADRPAVERRGGGVHGPPMAQARAAAK